MAMGFCRIPSTTQGRRPRCVPGTYYYAAVFDSLQDLRSIPAACVPERMSGLTDQEPINGLHMFTFPLPLSGVCGREISTGCDAG